jgi:hypothetical protein
MRRALIFAKMCGLRTTIISHVCARRVSVTKEGEWKRSGTSCV